MQNHVIETDPKLPADRFRNAVEFRHRILKLRWIGEESEAERLCAMLSQTAQDHIVVDEPLLTD